MTDYCMVYVTCSGIEEAKSIGRAMVEKRLVACANVLPNLLSIYRWKGVIEESAECLIMMKTSQEHLEALEAELIALHSYELPEFVAVAIQGGSQKYLQWLGDSLG